jgi:hypothetical protein
MRTRAAVDAKVRTVTRIVSTAEVLLAAPVLLRGSPTPEGTS